MAKFHYYKEWETVRQKAYENSTALKRENLGIGQQWPSEVRETRKTLFPIMQREKSQGKEVKLIKDKLYVNDVQYKLTPQERQSQQSAPQTPRYAPPPPPSYPPWMSYQNHGPPSQFGYMLESSEEAFEGFGVLRSFKANSYRIFGRPWSWSSRKQRIRLMQGAVKSLFVSDMFL